MKLKFAIGTIVRVIDKDEYEFDGGTGKVIEHRYKTTEGGSYPYGIGSGYPYRVEFLDSKHKKSYKSWENIFKESSLKKVDDKEAFLWLI
jgi:hypothetical protein